MNWQIFMPENNCTRGRKLSPWCVLFIVFFMSGSAFSEWSLDLSRRQKDLRRKAVESDRARMNQFGFVTHSIEKIEPAREIVILNTAKGFIPNTVRLHKGGRYKIHVVNVNAKEKNVSFIMDAFSEHHATYYGNLKTFIVEPKREGIFSFQCPETSVEGRVVVYKNSASRRLASEGGE